MALKTMTQIMAPITPFATEKLWQDVIRKYDAKSEISVHLSNFPTNATVNAAIIAETDKVRQIIATALRLRNEASIKVRQPLSTMYLIDTDRAAIKDYEKIILDELNIKEIVYLQSFDLLYNEYLLLDFKNAGKILKSELQNVKGVLDELSDERMMECVEMYKKDGIVSLRCYKDSLPGELFALQRKYKPHIYALDDNTPVALHTAITLELEQEGLYRELLRQCQVLRKEAGFEIAQRVQLNIQSNNDEVKSVLSLYAENLMKETLSSICEVDKAVMQKEIKINRYEILLSIGLKNR